MSSLKQFYSMFSQRSAVLFASLSILLCLEVQTASAWVWGANTVNVEGGYTDMGIALHCGYETIYGQQVPKCAHVVSTGVWSSWSHDVDTLVQQGNFSSPWAVKQWVGEGCESSGQSPWDGKCHSHCYHAYPLIHPKYQYTRQSVTINSATLITHVATQNIPNGHDHDEF
jgi:hypothetical protein